MTTPDPLLLSAEAISDHLAIMPIETEDVYQYICQAQLDACRGQFGMVIVKMEKQANVAKSWADETMRRLEAAEGKHAELVASASKLVVDYAWAKANDELYLAHDMQTIPKDVAKVIADLAALEDGK